MAGFLQIIAVHQAPAWLPVKYPFRDSIFVFHVFNVVSEGFQKLFLPVQAAEDSFIQGVIGTDIPDADVLILADPVDTVLALQAGGQIPAVGIVDDIMAELQVKAVARAVPVGNEEGGGFPEFLQVTEPFFIGREPSKRATFSGPYFLERISHSTSIS